MLVITSYLSRTALISFPLSSGKLYKKFASRFLGGRNNLIYEYFTAVIFITALWLATADQGMQVLIVLGVTQ